MQDLNKKFGGIYQAGMVLFREGDEGDELFIIQTGSVKISKKAKNAETILATLKAGDFFGEMSMFTDKKRSATATVMEKSEILTFKKTSFHFMIEQNQDFALTMIKTMSERLYRADQKIGELLSFSKETRLLKELALFWQREGKKQKENDFLIINYLNFLDHIFQNAGIDKKDANHTILELKNNNLLNVQKDHSNVIYITFKPEIFSYMEII